MVRALDLQHNTPFRIFFSFPRRVSPFSRRVIFTRVRLSLALLYLRKNEGLLVVYFWRGQVKGKSVDTTGKSVLKWVKLPSLKVITKTITKTYRCLLKLLPVWSSQIVVVVFFFQCVPFGGKSTLENLRILEKKCLLRLVYNGNSIWLQLSEFFSFVVFLGKSTYLACAPCFLILGHVMIPRKTFLSIVVLYATSTFPIMHLISPQIFA